VERVALEPEGEGPWGSARLAAGSGQGMFLGSSGGRFQPTKLIGSVQGMGSEAGVGEPEPGSVCVLLGLGERTVSGWSGVGGGLG